MVITEVKDLCFIKETCEKADSNSLVIFDIDDVLIMGKDQAMKPPHKQRLVHERITLQYSEHKALELVGYIWSQYKVTLIDKDILQLLDLLKSRHIKTIALTSGWTGQVGKVLKAEDQRIERLNNLGINFNWSFPENDLTDFEDLKKSGRTPLFKKGIIFSCDHPKHVMLKAFLENTGFKPKEIIFIEDHYSNLDTIARYCESQNIAFKGFHYTAVEHFFPEPLNEKRANLQFETLEKELKWLSDEEVKN